MQLLQECISHSEVQHYDSFNWVEIDESRLLRLAPFWISGDLERLMENLCAKGILLLKHRKASANKAYHFAFNEHDESISTTKETEKHDNTVYAKTTTTPDWKKKSTAGEAMWNTWQPGEDCLRQLAQLGVAREFCLQQIPEFVTYWRDRNVMRHSWESKYLKEVWRKWQQAESTKQQRRAEFSLTRDWRPSNDAIEILVQQGEINSNFVEDSIPEFILYWRDRGDMSSTWDSKFIQHVRRQWHFYTGMRNNETIPKPITASWQPTESVYDVLRMANIEREFAEQLVPQFVIYWRENGAPQCSWSTKFLQYVKSQWARFKQPQVTEPKHGKQFESNSKSRIRDRSIIEAISDRSWAS